MFLSDPWRLTLWDMEDEEQSGAPPRERLVMCCQTTGVSAAHALHCATYCTPCRPLIRAFSGWIRTPPPTRYTGTHGYRAYRGTPLTRKHIPLGPCLRPIPRVLGGSQGGKRCFMSEVPLYQKTLSRGKRRRLLILPTGVPRSEKNAIL